jgi:hypothetical protein
VVDLVEVILVLVEVAMVLLVAVFLPITLLMDQEVLEEQEQL